MQPQLYLDAKYPLRRSLRRMHGDMWEQLAKSGPFWSGADRMAILLESRNSLECELCKRRLAALSPNAVAGHHQTVTNLPAAAVEVIHRLRTDPARMTKSVFDRAISQGLTIHQYVELVGVMTTGVIIDTLHRAVGLPVPTILAGSVEPPTGQEVPDTEDAGAWLPISIASDDTNEIGIPRTANIVRSMGLVPAIVLVFFNVMRQTYLIGNLPVSLARSQTEFIAARVSALNECFY